MSSADATLRMILLGEDRSASKAVKGVGTEAEKSSGKLHSFGKVAAGVFAGGALIEGAQKAAEFLKGSVEAAVEDQTANAVLARQLKNTTGATQEQIKATEEWVTKTAEASGTAKSELTPTLTRLATVTGSVTKAQKLTTLAMNVSAGSGKSLSSVTAALIRAQNGSVTGLSRLGIKTQTVAKDTGALTRAQLAVKSAQLAYTAAVKAYGPQSTQAIIAAGKLKVAHQGVEKAQKATTKTTLTMKQVTKELAKQYKGDTAAAADTAAGKMKRLGVTWEEMKVQVGDHLLPVLTKLTGWILDDAIPDLESFGGWVRKNSAWLAPLVTVVGGLVAGFVAYSAALKVTSAAQAVWATIMGTTTAVSEAATVATEELAVAQTELDGAMDANPIGLVVVALGALAAGLIYAYKHSATFRAVVQAALHAVEVGFHALTGAATATFDWVKGHWKLLASIIGGPLVAAVILVVSNWGKIKAATSNAWNAVKSTVQNGVRSVLNLIQNLPQGIRALGGLMLSAGKSLIQALFRGIVSAAKAGVGFASDLVGAVKNAINSALHLPLEVNFDKGPLHIHATVIPALAKGGIVTRPTMALIGEAGPEAVVPLSGANRGGLGGDINITVNTNGLVDKSALIKDLHTELKKYRRLQLAGAPMGLG